jgi:hypothetical protein
VRQVADLRLADDAAERVRKSHADAIRELQTAPAADARAIRNVVIPDNGTVTKAHRLGRVPSMVIASPPRGAASAGLLGEVSRSEQVIVLSASGFGADITVDVTVF